RHCHRIGVLDQHRLNRGPAMQCLAITGQNTPDLGLIEYAYAAIDRFMGLNDRFIEPPDTGIVEEGTAAFILPSPGNRGNAQRRMHLSGAIAAAGKAIAKTEEGSLGPTDRARKGFDLLDRHA